MSPTVVAPTMRFCLVNFKPGSLSLSLYDDVDVDVDTIPKHKSRMSAYFTNSLVLMSGLYLRFEILLVLYLRLRIGCFPYKI